MTLRQQALLALQRRLEERGEWDRAYVVKQMREGL